MKAEIEELEELCKLYMKSNPSYDNKEAAAPTISESDVMSAVSSGLALVGRVAGLNALINEDEGLVECSDAQRASIASLASSANQMTQKAEAGSQSFGAADGDFSDAFTKLASGTADMVTDGGVSFADLKAFVTACYTDGADQIKQRIADKKLAAERQQKEAKAAADKAAKAAA